MRKLLTLLLLCYFFSATNAQVLTLVVDGEHNQTTAVETTTKTVSAFIQMIVTSPAWEKISEVQTFLKDAASIISAVVANMKITQDLIEEEQKIYALFIRSRQQIMDAEDLPDKWKHQLILSNLYYESLRVFEVFDIATQENRGIIDDKGRIQLIKDVLVQARIIRKAMKTSVRRANRSLFNLRKQQRELAIFTQLFQ